MVNCYFTSDPSSFLFRVLFILIYIMLPYNRNGELTMPEFLFEKQIGYAYDVCTLQYRKSEYWQLNEVWTAENCSLYVQLVGRISGGHTNSYPYPLETKYPLPLISIPIGDKIPLTHTCCPSLGTKLPHNELRKKCLLFANLLKKTESAQSHPTPNTTLNP